MNAATAIQTIARRTMRGTARRQRPNPGFAFNPAEQQIGRIVSISGTDVTVEYPHTYTMKDGSTGIYTVRDVWSAGQRRTLVAGDAKHYDAALWEAWAAEQE